MQTDIVCVDQVKGLKPAEVRQALCDAGLSPVGDKNELLKVRSSRELTVMIIFPLLETGCPLLQSSCGGHTCSWCGLQCCWEGGGL